MGNRRHVSPAVKEEVARLSLDPGLRVSDIARETGVSENTVRRTLDKWRMRGRATEVRPPAPKGRPSALQQRELEVRHVNGSLELSDRIEGEGNCGQFLERRAREAPNMALSDLRIALHTEFAVEISVTTIYHTLHKLGLMYNDSERCLAASQNETHEIHDEEEEESTPAPKRTFEEIDKERRAQFLLRAQQPEAILIALSYAGVLDVSISTGTNAAAVFVSRVLDAMRTFPSPHSVLIFDAARVHITAALKEQEGELSARHVHLSQNQRIVAYSKH
ncbi:hypothetical protein EW145_g845 [Phellinidium pouzarii]|uniref:Tc1-like transposase DDE domain-containing protein n=1 Tax=Phellinidium pouzarii TaxID=167371 RepID=A0A4S4LHE4_9AGAM|nr:hypothetical protein EW145_g845 [Phellinidium pouzarii]